MGCEQSKADLELQIAQENEKRKQQYAEQMQILQQLDGQTRVPHLLIELRSVGYIEVCGKNIGGIYDRLDEFFRRVFRASDVTLVMADCAAEECGCCVSTAQYMKPIEDWERVCDKYYACGQQTAGGTVIPNGVFCSRGDEGENNMGKLTMTIVNFMTNECGWGLQLVDGGNLGHYGQLREQQIKFKAPHPLNLIAPHIMIELRQVGYIEVNGPNTNGIYNQLAQFFGQTWGAKPTQADPVYCDLKFSCSGVFKKRGSEGENNMGKRTMEIVDFMTKQCAWTLITCNGGNYGRFGDKREQQLVFRNDAHVHHGENHVMVELRDQGYIEVNGLHDAQDIVAPLESMLKGKMGCQDYQQGFWESELYCDKKYSTPHGFYFRDGTTNNLGKRTVELATFLGQNGWMLMLCNGGNVSGRHPNDYKREQQIKITRGRPGEATNLPILMVELRTIPTSSSGRFTGVVEVNGPDTDGIYAKLSTYLQQTMQARPVGRTQFCDFMFETPVFRCRHHCMGFHEKRWDGMLNGESNFGRYTMRLCDFMVDHVGCWDLVVCNGNSIYTDFRIDKDNTQSVNGREQQLIFRYRPGGRAVFMADNKPVAALGHAPKEPPAYWKQTAKEGKVAQEIVPATPDETKWLQELLDGTYKNKKTRDRRGGDLADRFVVVSALRSEHPGLWDRYAKRRTAVTESCAARGVNEFIVPKTVEASPTLSQRVVDPSYGTACNEAYLLHGSNPTSAISILGTSFKVDFAGASAGTMFGPGVYLAEASSKADEYARDENTGGAYDGLFAVLVCRAVLGHSYVTEKPGNFAEKCTSGNFESIVGDREKAVGTYREFILFDEGSIYPEYVAFYRREYDDPDAAAKAKAAASAVAASAGAAAPPVSVAPTPHAMPAETATAMPMAAATPMAGATIGAPVMRALNIQVPEGAQPGQTLQAPAPWGQVVEVTIPPGVSPGQTLTVQVPAT
eukprot:TRINITY_DN2008_c0_g1_i2.p1 TRINITY_DN2008_c0_g1~~TRINITY_DN2008_c0_g1_i2.p1  ORF type:complete len:961 (+),score=141.05 TRINITY_DN2008_c0_g1_i2:71-2953(+)